MQECEDFMTRGIAGSGAGFDAAAAGKIGGRWKNPSDAERRLMILKVSCLAASPGSDISACP